MQENLRIGNGYDIHRLVENRKLILGGIEIPFEKGLLGHSDADVLVHAVMDAMLGALGLGDIGQHFPSSDNTWKNISSLILLEKVNTLINEKKYKISNLDSVIMAEKPKLKDYIPIMREKLSMVLGISADKISIKATTMEGIGAIGEEKAMASSAVILLEAF
jgi:2-C-methyl-D-erythritol 2,4-cyclodiphosphate synthase